MHLYANKRKPNTELTYININQLYAVCQTNQYLEKERLLGKETEIDKKLDCSLKNDGWMVLNATKKIIYYSRKMQFCRASIAPNVYSTNCLFVCFFPTTLNAILNFECLKMERTANSEYDFYFYINFFFRPLCLSFFLSSFVARLCSELEVRSLQLG